MPAPWKKSYDTPRQHIKKQRHHFATKHPYSQSYGFFSCHVWMWELDFKKGWMPKNWCFELWRWRRFLRVPWTTRRSDESILKEINLNIRWKDWCWSWSSKALATWCKELTCWKDPDAGKDWGQEEKRATEDDMVGWHHWLNEYKFEQTLRDSEGQGNLVCCSSWSCQESHVTEPLHNNNNNRWGDGFRV